MGAPPTVDGPLPGGAVAEDTSRAEAAPWYSLDPRTLRRGRTLKLVLLALLVGCVSIVPLWRLCWYVPIYPMMNFLGVKDHAGRRAWHWVEGKEIRVYVVTGVNTAKAKEIAAGARALMEDAGLDFTVKIAPIPPEVQAAYEASLVQKRVNGTEQTCISYDALVARLIELRAGDPHADMLVVDAPIAECWWAHGMAMFSSGVSVLESANVDFHLGKHEVCHLVGYMKHDDLPVYVFGYPWEGLPGTRDTLMMLNGRSTDLSPRARDALRAFWAGVERRNGGRYLR